jgi:hypothetical protein
MASVVVVATIVAIMPAAMVVMAVAMAMAVAGSTRVTRVDDHDARRAVMMRNGMDDASREEGGRQDSAHGDDTRDGRKLVEHRSSPWRPDGALVTHNGVRPPAVDLGMLLQRKVSRPAGTEP